MLCRVTLGSRTRPSVHAGLRRYSKQKAVVSAEPKLLEEKLRVNDVEAFTTSLVSVERPRLGKNLGISVFVCLGLSEVSVLAFRQGRMSES